MTIHVRLRTESGWKEKYADSFHLDTNYEPQVGDYLIRLPSGREIHGLVVARSVDALDLWLDVHPLPMKHGLNVAECASVLRTQGYFALLDYLSRY